MIVSIIFSSLLRLRPYPMREHRLLHWCLNKQHAAVTGVNYITEKLQRCMDTAPT